jgi:hypothetical protein
VRELFGYRPEELDSGAANMALRPLLGTRTVLLLDGAEHLRRRKLVLPPFHGERMRAYEELIREATRGEIATWPLGEPVPTLPRLQAITLRVILRAVFGLQEGPELDKARIVTGLDDHSRFCVIASVVARDWPRRLSGLQRGADAACTSRPVCRGTTTRRTCSAPIRDDNVGRSIRTMRSPSAKSTGATPQQETTSRPRRSRLRIVPNSS